MFDFSWAEMMVVALVGLLILGPEELPVVVRHIRKMIAKVKKIAHEFTATLTEGEGLGDLKEEASKLNQDIRTIIDLEGKEQPTYDISDIMQEIKTQKKEK